MKQDTVPFTGSFEAPFRFRHAMKDGIVIGSTGSAVYSFLAEHNTYTTESAPKDRPASRRLPEPSASLLHDQNPSLLLALVTDPQAALTQDATSVSRPIDTTIDGVAYPTLNARLKDKQTLTILFDPKTHLIRQWQRRPAGRPRVPRHARREDRHDHRGLHEDDPRRCARVPPPTRTRGRPRPAPGTSPPAPPPRPKTTPTWRRCRSWASRPPRSRSRTLEGKSVSPVEHGKVVILDFWATWCGPCRKGLPQLNHFYDEKKDTGLRVFAINIDDPDTRADVPKSIADLKLTLPVLLDKNGDAAKAYKVQPIPMTVVIGKDGIVKRVFIGLRPGGEDDLRKVVAAEMAK